MFVLWNLWNLLEKGGFSLSNRWLLHNKITNGKLIFTFNSFVASKILRLFFFHFSKLHVLKKWTNRLAGNFTCASAIEKVSTKPRTKQILLAPQLSISRHKATISTLRRFQAISLQTKNIYTEIRICGPEVCLCIHPHFSLTSWLLHMVELHIYTNPILNNNLAQWFLLVMVHSGVHTTGLHIGHQENVIF